MARLALTDRLIAMESAKTLPASALTVINYVAPLYPRFAATREVEGWVDLEFTVGRNGATQDIRVADASHERYFRDEAITAVQQWRFEPRIFMDQPIEQKTFTRVRFVLAE
jgi:TonB family protein